MGCSFAGAAAFPVDFACAGDEPEGLTPVLCSQPKTHTNAITPTTLTTIPTDFIAVRLLNKAYPFLLRMAVSPQNPPQRKVPLLEPNGLLVKVLSAYHRDGIKSSIFSQKRLVAGREI
jgi:hypothetical protein